MRRGIDPVQKAVGNIKRRMLLIAPTGGQVGYPAEYARYRQEGRFGEAPDKATAQSATKKPAEKGTAQPDGDMESSLERAREAAKDRLLEEDRLKHEERLALIQQGINPDSMQPFAEEAEARAMLLEQLSQQEEAGDEGFWSEPDFIKREDLLKRSAVPGAKVGKQNQFGKTVFKEMHLEKVAGDCRYEGN